MLRLALPSPRRPLLLDRSDSMYGEDILNRANRSDFANCRLVLNQANSSCVDDELDSALCLHLSEW